MKQNEWIKTLKVAFPHSIPVLTGFTVLGLAYGILMQSKGYGGLWPTAFSAICFCGSMQFVAITLLTTVFSPLQALLLSIMVNARHIFYGLSMLQKYKGVGKIKPILIYVLCDETFSILSTTDVPEGIDRKKFYLLVSLLDYSYWIIASTVGGLLGELININTEGLDFVLTALFVVLFLEQWKKKENRVPCIIGAVFTLISLFIFGVDNLVIPAMVGILACLLLMQRRLKAC